jgi:FkbM family methyltransferase
VFDVGANVGQSVREIRKASTLATIHAFEPVAATYEQLRAVEDPITHVHRLALSSSTGVAKMRSTSTQQTNAIVRQPNGHHLEEVPTMRGDEFCEQHGISRIDFLKIDAEGHDLEVLKGFEYTLARRRVGAVQVEVWFDRSHHPRLETFQAWLAPQYVLWRLVHQRGGARLQYCDAVFARTEVER